MRTTPLSALDEQFIAWDRIEPLCILCELRVEGRIDAERLIGAVRTAMSLHPMARCRLSTSRWPLRGQRWEIVDHFNDIPLEIVDCPDDDALDRMRSRLLGGGIDLRRAPPFALVLARRSAGDSLCMSLSHVAGDGMSAVRLMRSVACAYAGIEEAIAGPEPLEARHLSSYSGGSASAERIRLLRKALRLKREQQPEAPTTKFATESGETQEPDAGFRSFHALHLDRDETATVMAQRQAPATMTALLIASLAVAIRRWNLAHGVASHRMNVQTAVNLRPADWFTEVFSNFARDANVAVPESDQDSLADAQLAVAEEMRALKRRRESAAIGVMGPLNVVPRALRPAVARRLMRRPNVTYTVGLSNLGKVDSLPDLAHQAGRVTELWFSPPGTHVLGTLAGTLTLDDEMFLALHYLRDELSDAAARAFAETWRDVLLNRA